MTLHALAEKITLFLLTKKVIVQEKMEIYAYGMEILIATFINGFLVFCAAAILGTIPQTILLLIPFMLIRSNADGFHAKTHLGCTIGFLIVYVIGTLTVRAIPPGIVQIICASILVVSSCIILLIGAVEHENRVVTVNEFIRFRRKARILAVILSSLGMVGIILLPALISYYTLGLFIAACSLLVAWINIKREGGKNS